MPKENKVTEKLKQLRQLQMKINDLRKYSNKLCKDSCIKNKIIYNGDEE